MSPKKFLDGLYFINKDTCIVEVWTSVSSFSEVLLTHDTLLRLGKALHSDFKDTPVQFGVAVHNRYIHVELGYKSRETAKKVLSRLIEVRDALRKKGEQHA